MIKNSIVLVPFPFDDFKSSKVRPALCLTNIVGIYNHVIIAFISSKLTVETELSDIILKKKDLHFNQTGLTVDSVIKLHKLVTLPTNSILRKLGSIDITTSKEIQKKLQTLFELN